MDHFFEEEFEEKVLKSELPVLLDFYANWCGPCRALSPHITKISEDYTNKLKVVKVDCDECLDLAADFEIKTIPTLVIMKNGQEVDRRVGGARPQDLIKFIDKNMG